MSTRIAKPAALCLLAIIAVAPSIGCDNFYENESVAPDVIGYYVFDNSLPQAIEDLFANCYDPLAIEPGMSELDITDACEYADVSSTDAQLLYIGMAFSGAMDFGSSLPSQIANSTETVDGFPWPVQNCEISYTQKVYFDGLDLYDLQADWQSSSSSGKMHMDFDFNGEQKIGHAVFSNIDVDCPSGLSEWILSAFTTKARNELEGSHNIYVSSMDLDFYVSLTRNARHQVTGSTTHAFSVGDARVSIDWDKLSMSSSEATAVENGIRDGVEDAMSDSLGAVGDHLGDAFADMLNEQVEADHEVCSLSSTTSSLTMLTMVEGNDCSLF
ncbi:MAG: hypothetical protein HYV63_31505 [Candidatus Schekmanbacteria bacterium]|nr:hypothetical protein [Candidatus Schekmanbacteria bacterium]